MDKALLEQFSKEISDKEVKEFYAEYALPIISDVLDEVSNKNELINPSTIKVFPIGDYTNGTAIDELGGELEIVIACSNPQLQISNTAYIKEYIKASSKEKTKINIKNTSEDIMKTLYKAFISQFSEKTTLIMYAQGIKILCKEELGFNMLIRFATFNENDDDMVLSFWNTIKKQTEPVSYFMYADELEKKNKETKGNLYHLIRIFKSYRKTMLAKGWFSANTITRYFIEALAYNIPTRILKDTDFEKAYAKSMIYLQNCPLTKFKSFDGKPINKCKLIKVSYNHLKTYLNGLVKLDA